MAVDIHIEHKRAQLERLRKDYHRVLNQETYTEEDALTASKYHREIEDLEREIANFNKAQAQQKVTRSRARRIKAARKILACLGLVYFLVPIWRGEDDLSRDEEGEDLTEIIGVSFAGTVAASVLTGLLWAVLSIGSYVPVHPIAIVLGWLLHAIMSGSKFYIVSFAISFAMGVIHLILRGLSDLGAWIFEE